MELPDPVAMPFDNGNAATELRHRKPGKDAC